MKLDPTEAAQLCQFFVRSLQLVRLQPTMPGLSKSEQQQINRMFPTMTEALIPQGEHA
jgi:hypothetical protein